MAFLAHNRKLVSENTGKTLLGSRINWRAKFLVYVIPEVEVREYGWVRRLVYRCNGEMVFERYDDSYMVHLSLN